MQSQCMVSTLYGDNFRSPFDSYYFRSKGHLVHLMLYHNVWSAGYSGAQAGWRFKHSSGMLYIRQTFTTVVTTIH